MKKIAILAAAGISLGAVSICEAADTLRVATFLPERSMNVRFTLKPFMKDVTEETGGSLKMQGYWGGSLGRNPRKQLDLVLDGIADVTVVTPGYTPGRFPEMSAFELPYLFLNGTEASKVMWKMYEKGLISGFEDVHTLSVLSTDVYGVHTKPGIKSVNDIKGLKIRSAGPVQSDMLKHFGAIPVGLPISQATEALSRGVVDGVTLGYSGLTVFRMQTIAQYHYQAPLSIATLSIVMNKARYEKLSADEKAAIDKYAGITMATRGGGGFDKMAGIFFEKMKKEGGHTYIEWDPAGIEEDRQSVKSVHRGWIERTDGGQAFYDALIRTIEEVRSQS